MKNYHQEYTTEKKDNHVQYIGDYYQITLASGEKKRIFARCMVSSLVSFLLILLAGLINNQGSRNLLIAVPYAILFIPNFYLILGAVSVLKIEESMERIVYDKAIGRMYRSSIGIVGISFYLVVADLCFIFMENKTYNRKLEIVCLCTFLLVFLCNAISNRYLHNLKKRVTICKRENGVFVEK